MSCKQDRLNLQLDGSTIFDFDFADVQQVSTLNKLSQTRIFTFLTLYGT